MLAAGKSKSKAKTPKGAGKAKSITSFFQASGKKKAPSPGKLKKAPSAAAAAAKAAVAAVNKAAAKKKEEDTPIVVEKEKAKAENVAAKNGNGNGNGSMSMDDEQDDLSAGTIRSLTFSPVAGGADSSDDAPTPVPAPAAPAVGAAEASDAAQDAAFAQSSPESVEATEEATKMETETKESAQTGATEAAAAESDEPAAAAANAPTAAKEAAAKTPPAETTAEAAPVAAAATDKKGCAMTAAAGTLAAEAVTPATVAISEVKPCVWSKHVAPEEAGGLNYYFNSETQESAWVAPDDFTRWEREKTAYADAVAARRAAKLATSSASKSKKSKGPKVSKEEREKMRLAKLAGKDAAKAAKAAELERKAAARAEKERIEKSEKLARQVIREEEKRLRDQAKAEEKQKRQDALEADKKRREAEKAKIIEEKRLKREALDEERRKKKEAVELEKKEKREALEAEREANRKRKLEETEKRREEEKKAKLKKLGITTGMKAMFSSFVVKPKPAAAGGSADASKAAAAAKKKPAGKFSPFYCPPHMTLAPACRVNPGPLRRAALDVVLNGGEEADDSEDEEEAAAAAQPSTIEELRVLATNRWRQCMQDARSKPSKTAVAAAVREASAAAAAIAAGETPMTTATMTPEQKAFRRPMKLLSFHVEVRPPYYGTFGKASKVVKGRRPLAVDSVLVDYEYDSEAEWDPEDLEEGDECLSADEDDEEADAANNAEDGEDKWMVPHGYLSDDEVAEEDEEDELGNPMKKARKMTAAEAPSTPSRKKAVATRYSIGCKWGEAAVNHSKLGPHAMQIIGAGPIDVLAAPVKRAPPIKPSQDVPIELYPELIKMVHGSLISADRAAAEFTAAHAEVTKAAVSRLIKDPAFCVREVRAPYTKQRRFVQAEMLATHNLTDLPLPEPIVVEKAHKAPKQPREVPAELMPDLIKLVHGSLVSADRLVAEFSGAHPDVTKAAVSRLVKDKEGTFCLREVRAPYSKQRRFVVPQVLEMHGLTDLPLPEPLVVAKVAPSDSKSKRSIAQAFEIQVGPWTKHMDPTSKVFYYFNNETGASSWDKPTSEQSPTKAAEAGSAEASSDTPGQSKDDDRDTKRVALEAINPNA